MIEIIIIILWNALVVMEMIFQGYVQMMVFGVTVQRRGG